jgi:hypothetical protein
MQLSSSASQLSIQLIEKEFSPKKKKNLKKEKKGVTPLPLKPGSYRKGKKERAH